MYSIDNMQNKFYASNNTISLKKSTNSILCEVYNLGWVTVSDDRFYSMPVLT